MYKSQNHSSLGAFVAGMGYPSPSLLGEPPGLGGWIGEDALALGELLADIRHQTAGVAQGELVGHVVVDEVVVAFNLPQHRFLEWISREFLE